MKVFTLFYFPIPCLLVPMVFNFKNYDICGIWFSCFPHFLATHICELKTKSELDHEGPERVGGLSSSMETVSGRSSIRVFFSMKLSLFVFIYFVVVIEAILYVGDGFYKRNAELDLYMKVLVGLRLRQPLVAPPSIRDEARGSFIACFKVTGSLYFSG